MKSHYRRLFYLLLCTILLLASAPALAKSGPTFDAGGGGSGSQNNNVQNNEEKQFASLFTVQTVQSYPVTIKKTDEEGTPLDGWSFNVYDDNEDLVLTTGPTNANGVVVVELAAGNYEICEILQANWVAISSECQNASVGSFSPGTGQSVLVVTGNGDSFTIEFVSRSADGKTWTYRVTETQGRSLSHWVLGICDTPLSYTGAGTATLHLNNPDPTTGVYGIKWDLADSFTTGLFTVTFDEAYGFGEITVAVKSGGPLGGQTGEGTITGPDCDPVQPNPVTVTFVNQYTPPPTGSITIYKQVSTDGNPFDESADRPFDFNFSHGLNNTPFTISDTGVNGSDDVKVFPGLMAGTYTITENMPLPDGWTYLGAVCSLESNPIVQNPILTTPLQNGLSLNLQAGQNVYCFFGNNYTTPPPPPDIRLNLTPECEINGQLWWRVTNNNGVDVPYTWTSAGGQSGNGTATPGLSHFTTNQVPDNPNTTIIRWTNPSGGTSQNTKAHNNQPCFYHITFEKTWSGDVPPDLSGFTLNAQSQDGLSTAVCTYNGANLECVYQRNGQAKNDLHVPFGQTYTVTESSGPWTAVSGLGTFPHVTGVDANFQYVISPNSVCEQGTPAKFCTHEVVNRYAPDIRLNLTPECEINGQLWWRVTNNNGVDVPYTWTSAGGQSGNGTATPGLSHFTTNQVPGNPNTTIIRWTNPSGGTSQNTKAHNNQPCFYHITFEKTWSGDVPPDLSGFTLNAQSQDGLSTAVCTYNGANLECVYQRNGQAKNDLHVPFGQTYSVTESSGPWTAVSGLGTFPHVTGVDANFQYVISPNSVCEQGTPAKFCTHEVVNRYTPPAEGQLRVRKSINWGNFTPDDDASFTICISPALTDFPCKTFSASTPSHSWFLPPGDYTVTEQDPGPSWTVSNNGAVVAVVANQLSEVTITNTYTPSGPNCAGRANPDRLDCSSLDVVGECVLGVAKFTITNTGDPGEGDMVQPTNYYVFENDTFVGNLNSVDFSLYTPAGTVQLLGGGQLHVDVPFGIGVNKIRLVALQQIGHPGMSVPNAVVELTQDCLPPPPRTGSITITKTVIAEADYNVNPNQSFKFFSDELGPGEVADLGDGGQETFSDLPAGSYTIREAVAGNWNQSVVCSGGEDITYLNPDTGATIDLAAGEHVTCDFTNELVTYELTFVKELTDGSAALGEEWEFTLKSLISAFEGTVKQDFGVVANAPGAGGTGTTLVLPVDAYRVGEIVPAGYTLTRIDCGVGGLSASPPTDNSFTIILDQNLTCTFINDQDEDPTGSIRVRKLIENAPQTFAPFEICIAGGPDNIAEWCKTFSAHQQSHLWSNLTPGSGYMVYEKNPGPEWTVSGEDDDVTVVADEITLVRITNTYRQPEEPTYDVTIQKVSEGAEYDAQVYFNGSFGPFDVNGMGGMFTIEDQDPGNYTVSETVPDGWTLTSVVCNGVEQTIVNGNSVTFSVTDSNVLCVFTNTYTPPPPPCPTGLDPYAHLSATIVQVGPNLWQGVVVNTSDCTYDVGMASYKKYDYNLSTQELVDFDEKLQIGPGTHYLTVETPNCAVQIDVYFDASHLGVYSFYTGAQAALDLVPLTLPAFGTGAYGPYGNSYGPRLLAVRHINGTRWCGELVYQECRTGTMTILGLTNGQELTGVMSVQATFSHQQPTKVVFDLNGAQYTDSTLPYYYLGAPNAWDTTGLGAGGYNMTIRAFQGDLVCNEAVFALYVFEDEPEFDGIFLDKLEVEPIEEIVEEEPVDQNTGDQNTGDQNTGDQNTGDQNTGDQNTGDQNTGDQNTGDQNTGDQNTGDQNTGDQNTESQTTEETEEESEGGDEGTDG